MTEGAKLYFFTGSAGRRFVASGLGLLVSLALVAGGCAAGPVERVSGVYAHDSRELVRLDHDYDGDGRIDARVYMGSGRPVRLEADANGDGLVDRRESYGAGTLVRAEADTNGDGLMDRWEEYRDGAVVRLLLDDEKRHGRPTRRIVYGPAAAARLETDLDGDGQWEAAPQ